MTRKRMAKTVALDDQIMAFLEDKWPMCYTVGEIAEAFSEAGWEVPNWSWCEGGSHCKTTWQGGGGYVHDEVNGIDRWTYTPYGQVISPRMTWLEKEGLVVKIPPFSGGRTNSWHAAQDRVASRQDLVEDLECLLSTGEAQ